MISDAVPSEMIERAIALARQLQDAAVQLQTPAEARQQAELERMLQNPADKVTLMRMTDEAFRSKKPRRAVDQFTHILDVQGVPRFFSPIDRALLRGFQSFGAWLPGVAVPLARERMRHETANVILPGEEEMLTEHLRRRTQAGLRMNVNFLGEALLGEREAQRRLDRYRAALQLPEIEVLSVKISTVYSQTSALARKQTVRVLIERLGPLIEEAARLRFTRPDGTSVPKFIYLDMEEYRDMSLTAEAFVETLNLPALRHAAAGIALQAYLPDSARTQNALNEWARRRIEEGGAAVTIRLVKGANMEMERLEASLRGWPQAPFKSKLETDANYKRMLITAFQPENLAAVRVGVGSHNLFDLAFALTLAEETGAGDRAQFEMLEGMANHQRRALGEKTRQLLLYAPACRKEEFVNAIGYLIRRLDENTGPDNFLRHAFRLHVGSAEWTRLENQFRKAFAVELSDGPRRTQNRWHDCDPAREVSSSDLLPNPPTETATATENFAGQTRDWFADFQNDPDTDFSLPHNTAWAEELVADCLDGRADSPEAGTPDDVDSVVACAKADRAGWRALSPAQRSELLANVANEIRRSRGKLLRSAMVNARKTIGEADPEVSEAVDFVEFYRRSARFFEALPGLAVQPKGVIVVVSPWNFPVAIPCGGIAAALAAGNTVILKPSSHARDVAHQLCRCFWRAGVSRETLQFFPCSGEGAGAALVHHPDVNAVILTGGTETALRILREQPELLLFAETGGKNATIVTGLSDREQAVKDVIHSAFSHGGQKCSATSLLLLEAEVYDDPDFKRMLCDAAESLFVGAAADLQTRIGPLIRPPTDALARGLTELEPGETWALAPHQLNHDSSLWSPGIKWGVQAGSFTHTTELFGPVLGVIRFTSLAEAIAIVNATGYGLTSGLESLDDREQEAWKSEMLAGNLYINRPTTGAIVLRQPFGGFAKSCIGPGLKAGGPNYLLQFLDCRDAPFALDSPAPGGPLSVLAEAIHAAHLPEGERILRAFASYASWWGHEFGIPHDHFQLLGEDNIRRYLPIRVVRIRIEQSDSWFEILARVGAACVTGACIVISAEPEGKNAALDRLEEWTRPWAGRIEFVDETAAELADQLDLTVDERIRFAAPERVPTIVRRAAAEQGIYLADYPVLAHGRVELVWYLREQSISHAYHRYGNLGARTDEMRAEPQ